MPTMKAANPGTREEDFVEEPFTQVLSQTRSLCPQCLRPITAHRVREGDDVYLVKECPEHGTSRAVIWRGGPALETWTRPKTPSTPKVPATTRDKGCPFDCGLCPEHGQHTCSALLELTSRCDLGCPICFADSDVRSPDADPDMATIAGWLDSVERASGMCNIQLSGGEPAVRDDLPEIVSMAKSRGFPLVLLNTNGLRLARDEAYLNALAEAGLDSLYLQFDGVSDGVYESIRGRALLRQKERAVERAAAHGLGIVLVATVVPGVNDRELGDLLRWAIQAGPAVRGVHFQPISYFGRYPHPPADADRITLPEIMRGLESQSDGLVRAADFIPPGCEHSQCSFHATYFRNPDGSLRLLRDNGQCCSPKPGPIVAADGARAATSFTARQWKAPECDCSSNAGEPLGDFDAFLAQARRSAFTVSAMAFQDAWTLDLERVQGCCIHCVAPDGRLVPFCAYNLTAADGRSIHRNAHARS
nr:radical SAM (seleno)protein TrsS [Oceanidesulfovibrio marinus]